MFPSRADNNKPDGKKPNIILIISDDHAVQALGIKDKSINYLPNLNKLAEEGMLFNKSYCCNSICGPSRAAIMTGRHSHKNGFVSHVWNKFDGSQPTYPKMLQKAGYRTGYIGKWHLNSDPVGFDYWDILPGQGCYYSPDFYGSNGKKRINGYATDIITDLALDWLKGRDKEKPFMLVVGHKAPHRPWMPAARHLNKVDISKMSPPKNFYDDYKDRPEVLAENEMTIARHFRWGGDVKILSEQVPDELQKFISNTKGTLQREFDGMDDQDKKAWQQYREQRTKSLVEGLKEGGKLHDPKAMAEWKWRVYMQDYLAVLLAIDESVGKITQYVDNEGLDKDTIIIYCSDQGFFLGEHGMYDKRWAFEESAMMPLIMRWKGKIAPGKESEALVQNIDYAPTFADLAGADTSDMGFQGRSLVPLFKTGASKDWRSSLYYAYYEWPAEHNVARHDAIITDRYMLAYFPRTREWMMFDNKNDPAQMDNLAGKEEFKDVREQLKEEYKKLRLYYGVPDGLPGATREKIFPVPSWDAANN